MKQAEKDILSQFDLMTDSTICCKFYTDKLLVRHLKMMHHMHSGISRFSKITVINVVEVVDNFKSFGPNSQRGEIRIRKNKGSEIFSTIY